MKPWKPGETRVFRYVHRSKPTPKGATVHGFVHSHHDQHSVLVELSTGPRRKRGINRRPRHNP